MIKIQCSAADAYLIQTETLTAGMVNLPVVKFEFSKDWEDMGKTAVVRAGEVSEELLVVADQIIIPASCMADAGVNLIVGVWGANASVELPTVWCACGEILDGTDPSAATNHEEASTSEVAQMLAYAEAIEEYAETLDGNVIRSVDWDISEADNYGNVSVVIQDTGVGVNRKLTFKFINLKGLGIAAVTFEATGEHRGRIQVRLENDEIFNYDGVADALAALDDFESDISSAEAARAAAELLRESAEVSRSLAETSRATAETGRNNAETARVAAESSRVTAEQQRVQAESQRVIEYNGMINTMNGIKNDTEALKNQTQTIADNALATESRISILADSAESAASNAAESATEAAQYADDASANAALAAAHVYNVSVDDQTLVVTSAQYGFIITVEDTTVVFTDNT